MKPAPERGNRGTGIQPTANPEDWGKLLLRLAVGILILLHGIAKLRFGLGDVVPALERAHILAVLGHPRELFRMTDHGGLLLEVQWMFFAGAATVALIGAGRHSVGGAKGRWN